MAPTLRGTGILRQIGIKFFGLVSSALENVAPASPVAKQNSFSSLAFFHPS
jgi:hypothetical protein